MKITRKQLRALILEAMNPGDVNYEDTGDLIAGLTYGMSRQGGVDIIHNSGVIANVPPKLDENGKVTCYDYEDIFNALRTNKNFMTVLADYMGDDPEDVYYNDEELVDAWNGEVLDAEFDNWTDKWDCEDVSELEALDRESKDDAVFGWDRDRY